MPIWIFLLIITLLHSICDKQYRFTVNDKWFSWSKSKTLLGQIQEKNNYAAKAGWNTALDHINSDALSIFCDISNCPSTLCMIHFFDGLDQKKKSYKFFKVWTALSSINCISQHLIRKAELLDNIWNKGFIIEIWAYTITQNKSISSTHCSSFNLSDFHFSSKQSPRSIKRNYQITMQDTCKRTEQQYGSKWYMDTNSKIVPSFQ